MKNRIFTDQELKQMGRLTLDLIHEAIDNGDYKKAKGLSKRMYQEFMFMHDLYRDWVTALMTYIYENYGENALYESMKKAVATYLRTTVELHQKLDFRKRVETFVAGVRGHGQPIEITEDDEKIIVKGSSCPGKLLLESGKYGPPTNFAMIQTRHALTFQADDFPIYCCHAPIQEQLAIDWIGQPVYVSNPPSKMGREPCECYIYKNNTDIPETVYKRVDRQKFAL